MFMLNWLTGVDRGFEAVSALDFRHVSDTDLAADFRHFFLIERCTNLRSLVIPGSADVNGYLAYSTKGLERLDDVRR